MNEWDTIGVEWTLEVPDPFRDQGTLWSRLDSHGRECHWSRVDSGGRPARIQGGGRLPGVDWTVMQWYPSSVQQEIRRVKRADRTLESKRRFRFRTQYICHSDQVVSTTLLTL